MTYKRSEEAREAESKNSTIYTRVYSAKRPELFFKAMGYDVVGSGEAVGIRADASWSVPEPELVVVLNAHMEVVGFTIGNDMSSRDIEGENPLYLPQAKVYERACALGPRLWLQPGATTFPDVDIKLVIERAGEVAFSGQTSTGELHRPLNELVEYLGRCKRFKYGAMLFTGTGSCRRTRSRWRRAIRFASASTRLANWSTRCRSSGAARVARKENRAFS